MYSMLDFGDLRYEVVDWCRNYDWPMFKKMIDRGARVGFLDEVVSNCYTIDRDDGFEG